MIRIGDLTVDSRVWLAPMTGVSDLPFRKTAAKLGARYVATEMVASELLASAGGTWCDGRPSTTSPN
jgi:tRNA-dihydrouridine synthase